jgi:hypothetical protein
MSAESIPAPERELEWRVIPGFTDYEVSNHGDVKRVKPDRKGRLSGKFLKSKPFTRFGHRQIELTNNLGEQEWKSVHVLVLEAFVGFRPTPKHECRHLDGEAGNNWLGNLTWGTGSENHEDRRRHGTDPGGERNGRAILTNAQAQEILMNNPVPLGARRRPAGLYAALSAKYNVAYHVIDCLFQRKTFRDVL